MKGRNATMDRLVGLTSYGVGDCAENPGVYTSTISRRSWIVNAQAALLRARREDEAGGALASAAGAPHIRRKPGL